MRNTVLSCSLLLLLSLACDPVPQESKAEQERTLSPESAILPAPLDQPRTVKLGPSKKASPVASVLSASKVPTARPLFISRPLVGEPLPAQLRAGLQLEAEFLFSGVRPSVLLTRTNQVKFKRRQQNDSKKVQRTVARPTAASSVQELLWPQFRIDLLPKTNKKPARLNFEFQSRIAPFPSGTQLRSRADRSGFLVVWPNGRSYRVVPESALSALFRERRADVTPPLPTSVEKGLPEKQLGKTAEVQLLKNSSVEVRILSIVAPESGGEQLCRLLLSIGRVARSAQFCRDDLLPVRVEFTFFDRKLSAIFQVKQIEEVANMQGSRFLMPPQMPIFKPGELPPKSNRFWQDTELKELGFDLNSENKYRIKNESLEHLYLVAQTIPVAILSPGQEMTLPDFKESSLALRGLLGRAFTAEVNLKGHPHWLVNNDLDLIVEETSREEAGP